MSSRTFSPHSNPKASCHPWASPLALPAESAGSLPIWLPVPLSLCPSVPVTSFSSPAVRIPYVLSNSDVFRTPKKHVFVRIPYCASSALAANSCGISTSSRAAGQDTLPQRARTFLSKNALFPYRALRRALRLVPVSRLNLVLHAAAFIPLRHGTKCPPPALHLQPNLRATLWAHPQHLPRGIRKLRNAA